MKAYVKSKSENLWHWIFDCPRYPEGSRVEVSYKYPGDKKLCPLCKQIEAGGKTKRKMKEILDDNDLH